MSPGDCNHNMIPLLLFLQVTLQKPITISNTTDRTYKLYQVRNGRSGDHVIVFSFVEMKNETTPSNNGFYFRPDKLSIHDGKVFASGKFFRAGKVHKASFHFDGKMVELLPYERDDQSLSEPAREVKQ